MFLFSGNTHNLHNYDIQKYAFMRETYTFTKVLYNMGTTYL